MELSEQTRNLSPETKDNLEFEFSQIMKEAEITRILIPLFRENREESVSLVESLKTDIMLDT